MSGSQKSPSDTLVAKPNGGSVLACPETFSSQSGSIGKHPNRQRPPDTYLWVLPCDPLRCLERTRWQDYPLDLSEKLNACLKTPLRAPTFAMWLSWHTLTTARPPSSTRCCSRPTPSLPTQMLKTESWTPATSKRKRASPFWRRTPPCSTTALPPTVRPSPLTLLTPRPRRLRWRGGARPVHG